MAVILCAKEPWSYHDMFLKAVFLLFIALCITVSILKNACDNEYFKKHFKYQYKIALIFFPSYIALVFISVFLVNNAAELIVNLIAYCASTLITVTIGVWFLYKNIKGMVYLVVKKEL
jgi:uncharacterized membrane protein